MRWLMRITVFIIVFYLLPAGCMFAQHTVSDGKKSWWELRRDSSEQAPPAADNDEAIVQVYAARAARWRGSFGVHTWIATKRRNETSYTRMEVIGYSVFWGNDAVRIRGGSPDSYWFGNRPFLLRDIRGAEKVEAIIDRLYAAATFVAYLARKVPELRLELPSTAIGKDYVPWHHIVAKTPSGTGAQVSLKGYAGLVVGVEEGIEVNVLGLTAGIDLYPPAIKLPAIGRIGFSDYRRFGESDLPAR